jgi:hypothetical protein
LEADIHAERARSPISPAVDLHTPTSEPQLQPERPSAQAAEQNALSIFNEAALSSVLSGDISIRYEDNKLMFKLLRKLASPIPGTKLMRIMGPSSAGNKNGQWVLLPRSAKNDVVCSKRMLRLRSRGMKFCAEAVGVGPGTMASWIKNDRELFDSAVKLRPTKVVMTAADSAFVQAQMKLSNSSFKALKKLFRTFDVPVSMASAISIKSHMHKYEVESCYYANVPMEASGGGKMSCLAYIASLLDIVQRDRDFLFEKGENYTWTFPVLRHTHDRVQDGRRLWWRYWRQRQIYHCIDEFAYAVLSLQRIAICITRGRWALYRQEARRDVPQLSVAFRAS